MNTDKSLDFTFIEQLVIVLLCSCFFVGGIFFGRQIEKEAIRKDAVKNKAAHWIISDEGIIKFEWNMQK